MEVDISPQGGARPATPRLGENSDPPSGPTTPTPLPWNSLKRRALFSLQKTPNAAPAAIPYIPQALLICDQLKQSNKTDYYIFLCLPASSSLQAIRPHGIQVTLAGKVLDMITQNRERLSYCQRRQQA
ncbi:predicted protein [Aspergillus nidulans FGSC A4]|uniref:Uncharacterized protein n=1 Tax=Emericella nidulans (strain FGSC A4 / ATCC 38163 / CBS 112.46 / NRRL 194 / M139) TaxID=227321 RepID=Q5B930_EMENI|nr:hypothetical protein [Aspergillus nidulans FGSC A4]EAA63521.1 predicted protein [Aspergillus nidulans FGSC A4]CBF83687.1 TPA: hypothetical protein ANIA_02950 [Aspergillus nidulans FGSC A4]|eukprot:XP_660554.1 predicted protein [Aspergillus nidulans FGSC A4]